MFNNVCTSSINSFKKCNNTQNIKCGIIKKFEKTHDFEESSRNNFGRIEHFGGFIYCIYFAVICAMSQKYGEALFGLGAAYINSGLDKMFHNIAMRKSQVLVRYLHSNGIHDEKYITDCVDLYLKKRGGIIYSSFVRKFQRDKIKQVANGESASQFEGILTYIRNKYTLISPFNKAQMIKAKRNIKKIFAPCL